MLTAPRDCRVLADAAKLDRFPWCACSLANSRRVSHSRPSSPRAHRRPTREPSFLSNPRTPASVSGDTAVLRLCVDADCMKASTTQRTNLTLSRHVYVHLGRMRSADLLLAASPLENVRTLRIENLYAITSHSSQVHLGDFPPDLEQPRPHRVSSEATKVSVSSPLTLLHAGSP